MLLPIQQSKLKISLLMKKVQLHEWNMNTNIDDNCGKPIHAACLAYSITSEIVDTGYASNKNSFYEIFGHDHRQRCPH